MIVPENVIAEVETTSQPQLSKRKKIWTFPFILAILGVIFIGFISLFSGGDYIF